MAFSTHLLDQALKQKERKREEARQQYLSKVREALHTLAGEIPFEEAYIFGSLTRPGRFAAGISDVDIAFKGLRDEDFFRAMSFLSAALGTELDIIQLEGHPLEQKIKEEGARWIRPG